jgi:hypothetical protein
MLFGKIYTRALPTAVAGVALVLDGSSSKACCSHRRAAIVGPANSQQKLEQQPGNSKQNYIVPIEAFSMQRTSTKVMTGA